MTTKVQTTSETGHVEHGSWAEQVSITARCLDWLLRQRVEVVLLCSILGFLGYLVIWGIPAHLRQIQDGYERIQAAYMDERKLDREDAKTNFDRLEKAIERLVSRRGGG